MFFYKYTSFVNFPIDAGTGPLRPLLKDRFLYEKGGEVSYTRLTDKSVISISKCISNNGGIH